MNLQHAQAAIEAILFAASFPVAAEDIASALEVDIETVRRLLMKVEERFSSSESGVALIQVEDGFLMMSRPEYSSYVERLSKRQRPAPLSAASLETLAIVAYRQPVTRGDVEKIRGVNSDSAIATLAERGLIAEAGRRNSVGRPMLYATTPQFLLHMGLSSLEQLPELPDEASDEAAAASEDDLPSEEGSLPGLS